MQQATLKFLVITNQYDPVTGTDYLLTRQELSSGSPAEAKQLQQKLIPELEQSGLNYRCYIQKCQTYYQESGKKSVPLIERRQILEISNLMEIQGSRSKIYPY